MENSLIAAVAIAAISLYVLPYFISLSRYVDPYLIAIKELKKENRKFPLISLIVAVKNEENFISDCVNSMINQTYENKEIIVVNDGSDDGTKDILNKNFADNSLVKIIHLGKNIGKKGAIAEALRIANGDFFAFTDSDSTWKEDAIERIVTIFENEPNVGAISGHCHVMNADSNTLTRMQDSWYDKQFRVRKGFESIFGSVSCVSGPLACYRRSAIYNYISAWKNDTFLGSDFNFATDRVMTGFVLGGKILGPNIKKNYKDSHFVTSEDHHCINWKVVYSESAHAWTRIPISFKNTIKQKIRWNKSFIRNLFHTGKFYWRISPFSALYYYLHALYVFALPSSIIGVSIFLLYDNNIEMAGLFLAALIGIAISVSYFSRAIFRMDWFHNPISGAILALVTPWLIFYSLLTIRDKSWVRDTGGGS